MKNFARTLVLSLLVTIPAAPSLATVITFDFAGTVSNFWTNTPTGGQSYDPSRIGTAFSAQLRVDTDLLLQRPPSDTTAERFIEFVPQAGAPGVTGSLIIGGEAVDLTAFANDSGNVSFVDSFGFDPVSSSMTHDSWGVGTFTQETFPGFPYTGEWHTRGLSFISSRPCPDFPVCAEGNALIDLTNGADIESIATLDIADLYLSYSDAYWNCGGAFCIGGYGTQTTFSVSSFTRSVAPSSVPEPGTLALFSLGLAGMALMRRRRSLTA